MDPQRTGPGRRASRSAAVGVLAVASGALLARRALRDWGATPAERALRLPGDELVPDPATSSTLAVTVRADADDVWPWLVQVGADRGGLYSLTWAENLLGLGITDAERVYPEWQHLAAGDRVVLVPPGWGPLPGGYSLPVARLEPGRFLVLLQQPPEHPWHAVWSFHLLPAGPCRTRLLSRSREQLVPGAAGAGRRVAGELMRPVTVAMTHAMLRGLAARAERTSRPHAVTLG